MAVVYGGQNHVRHKISSCRTAATAASPRPPLPIDANCPRRDLQVGGSPRNPARIDCASIYDRALVNSWTSIFGDSILDRNPAGQRAVCGSSRLSTW